MTNKTIYTIVGVVVVILIILGIVAHSHKAPNGSKSAGQTNLAAKVEDVDSSQVPQGFPTGVPIESGATMTSNFSGTFGQNQSNAQATREFITTKSADENLTLYQNWLKTNNWTITNTLNSPVQKVIYASQGKNNLTIRIYTAADGKLHVGITNIMAQ